MSGDVTRQDAANEAAAMLRWAEKGWQRSHGTVPLEVRLTLGEAWVKLVAALGPDAVGYGPSDATGHDDDVV